MTEQPLTREFLEVLFLIMHQPMVRFFFRRTRDVQSAQDLAERVFVALAREREPRSRQEWTTWTWNTAHRVYDDYFLEGCGVQP